MPRSFFVAPGLALALIAGTLVVAGTLAGCTGMSRLSEDPPPGVNLAGNWQLDPRLSTDPQKALKQIVPPPSRRQSPQEGSLQDILQSTDEQGPPGRGRGGQSGSSQYAGENGIPIDTTLQQSLLSGGDFLKIEQRPSELAISNGETTRSFIPGERSVVSVPSGVADQSSGWKGKEYWIEIKPQVGPRVTEKLRRSDKGDQLIETIDVGSEGRVKPLHVVRVYNPAQEAPGVVLPGVN
jgi:hypothetical protein